jgi:N-acyl homoserine lactone hydrolase
LYVFDCGSLKTNLSRFNLKPEEVTTSDLSVACFLVDHPKGKLMWDVGAVPDEDWSPQNGEVAHHIVLPDAGERDLFMRKRLLSQLAELGYSPKDITYVAFSHYHWDHTANANVFAQSTWLTRQAERDGMFAEKAAYNTRPSTYEALKNAKTVIMPGDEYDVFGDGTAIMKLAPGHTPTHQVLYVNLPRTGPVVLSGDLYHFPESRTLKRVTTFEYDAAQTQKSREAIEAFLVKTGAQLWIQHDLLGNARLKKSPDFYD